MTIVLGVTGNELCPIQAFFAYLWIRGGVPGPLLMHKDGSALAHSYFFTRIQAVLAALAYTNTSHFSGHSFQDGAATTAAATKVKDSHES